MPLIAELWFEFNIERFEHIIRIAEYKTLFSISTGSYTSKPGTAISDTGTSYIVGPADEIIALAKSIGAVWNNATGEWRIPCSERAPLPPLNIKINGKTYSIEQHNYMVTVRMFAC